MEEFPNTRYYNNKKKIPFTKELREQAAGVIGCKPATLQFFPSVYDPFNPSNKINATVCKQEGHKYGSMVITVVNDQVISDPECIHGTPTIQLMPIAETTHQKCFLGNKWNGENITFFKYQDNLGNIFVSARPRIFPFVRDFQSLTYVSFIKNILGLDSNQRQATEEPKVEGEVQKEKLIDITSLPPVLLLLNSTNIQSITFELCGNQLPGLVSYDFPLDLKPLFYTETNGTISPIIIPCDYTPPEKNAEFKEHVRYVSRDIGPLDFNREEIKAILRDFKERALMLNENHRIQNNLMRGYNFYNFVIEGKVLYCMNEDLKLTNRFSMYKVKPSDINDTHSVIFDSVMQYKVIEGLSKIYSRAEPLTEEKIRQEMDMPLVSWDRFGSEIMELTKGIPNIFDIVTESVQKMLVMVGLPGSGKSTAAKKLLAMNDGWNRVNQDELKTRVACEKSAREFLNKGYSVIVDRCNFDIKQRNTWVKIASEFGVTDVRCLFFNIDPNICKERVTIREDHPTIPKGESGIKIIDTFLSSLLPPLIGEGFTEIITIVNEKELDDALIKLAQIVEFSPVCLGQSPGKKMRLNPNGKHIEPPSPPKEDESEKKVFNPFEALLDIN